MRWSFRQTAAVLILTAVVGVQGCARLQTTGSAQPVAGSTSTGTSSGPTAAGSSGTGPTAGPSTGCGGSVIADPWIVFEPPLSNGAELVVGDRGWIGNGSSAATIEVAGSADAVVLTDESAPTLIKCGKVISTAQWVEVSARSTGTVTLTVGGTAPKTLRITVVES